MFWTWFYTGWHKKTVITKNRLTSKILFRLTQNFSYIRWSVCSRHLQSFKSVLQKLFVSLALEKCAPNELPGAAGPFESRHIWVVVVLEPEWSNDAMFGDGNPGSALHRVQWRLQTVLRGCATPEDVVFRVHVTWQQKMCLVRKADIVKKVWHSCVDRLLPKICLNYKYLLRSSPWHLEGQIW